MMKRPFVETHIQGDTLDMSIDNDATEISVPDYPASDGWTLKYRLTPKFSSPTQAPIDITASTDSDGESYKVQVAPATTANWEPGSYSWARWIEKSGARVTLDVDGQLDIIPDPSASAQGDDRRSHARKMLESIEAAIEALNLGAKAYSIGTRSYTREDLAALVTMHSKYSWMVANEDARDKLAAGLPNPRKVGIRLTRP